MKSLVVIFQIFVGREEEEPGSGMYTDLLGVADDFPQGDVVEVHTWKWGVIKAPSKRVVKLAEIPPDVEPLAASEEEVVRMVLPEIVISLTRLIWATMEVLSR